jgi:hypothetical protein
MNGSPWFQYPNATGCSASNMPDLESRIGSNQDQMKSALWCSLQRRQDGVLRGGPNEWLPCIHVDNHIHSLAGFLEFRLVTFAVNLLAALRHSLVVRAHFSMSLPWPAC